MPPVGLIFAARLKVRLHPSKDRLVHRCCSDLRRGRRQIARLQHRDPGGHGQQYRDSARACHRAPASNQALIFGRQVVVYGFHVCAPRKRNPAQTACVPIASRLSPQTLSVSDAGRQRQFRPRNVANSHCPTQSQPRCSSPACRCPAVVIRAGTPPCDRSRRRHCSVAQKSHAGQHQFGQKLTLRNGRANSRCSDYIDRLRQSGSLPTCNDTPR